MPKTYELKAEYEIKKGFWPRKKREWKVFWRNPWRYWRSYVLDKKMIRRFADQIRRDVDAHILAQLIADNPPQKTASKPITGIINHEIL